MSHLMVTLRRSFAGAHHEHRAILQGLGFTGCVPFSPIHSLCMPRNSLPDGRSGFRPRPWEQTAETRGCNCSLTRCQLVICRLPPKLLSPESFQASAKP